MLIILCVSEQSPCSGVSLAVTAALMAALGKPMTLTGGGLLSTSTTAYLGEVVAFNLPLVGPALGWFDEPYLHFLRHLGFKTLILPCTLADQCRGHPAAAGLALVGAPALSQIVALSNHRAAVEQARADARAKRLLECGPPPCVGGYSTPFQLWLNAEGDALSDTMLLDPQSWESDKDVEHGYMS